MFFLMLFNIGKLYIYRHSNPGISKKKILVLWVQVNEDCYSSYTVILQTLEVNKSTSVSMPLFILKNQRAEKEKNLQATAVSDEDFTTSVKSGIDALGSGNPMTIQTSGALPGTITVQGGQYIMIQYPCYLIHRVLYPLKLEVGWVVFQRKIKDWVRQSLLTFWHPYIC